MIIKPKYITFFLIIFSFNFFSFIWFKKVTNIKFCAECIYKGGISKALKNNSGNYKLSVIQLGESLFTLNIENCNISEGGILELSGTVNAHIPNKGSLTTPVRDIVILYCSIENRRFKVKEILCVSDLDGHFLLKVKMKDNYCLIVQQNEKIGIVYSLSDFKIK